MTVARVTQASSRVVSNGTPNARITQLSVRLVAAATVSSHVTQASARVVSTNAADDSAVFNPLTGRGGGAAQPLAW